MSIADVMAKSLALAKHQQQNYTGRRCPFFCPYCGDKEMSIIEQVSTLMANQPINEQQRIADLERQVAALTNEKDIRQRSCEALVICNKELNEQLAAAQAVNEKLRELLAEIEQMPILGWHKGVASKALALPSDTTALQARLAEEREKCALKASNICVEAVEAIRSMS